MDPTTKQALVKAINLVKSGDKQSAVPILAGLLKKEPTLVQAWYLLGLAFDAEERKIKAFSQAVKLDPNHEKAKAQLAKLQAAAPSLPETPALSPAPQEPEPVESAPPPPAISEEPAWQPPAVQESEPEPDAEPPQEETLPFPEETPFVDDTPQEPAEIPEEPEAPGEIPIEDTPLPTDFDLPDWMDKESFDPSDYGTPDEDEIYLNTEAEIPEWAQMNPFEAPAEPAEEPVPAPPEEDKDYRPLWSDEDPDEKYTGSYNEEEPAVPDWATSSYDDQDEVSDQFASEDSDVGRVEAFFEEQDQAEQEADSEEGEAEETDEDPDDPNWLREMVDEEGKGKKRRRKSLTPTQKRRRRRMFVYLILLLIAAGVGTAGHFYREELQPYWDTAKPYLYKVVDPVKTQAAPFSAMLTEGAPLTDILTPGFFTDATPTNTIPAQPTAVPTRTPGNTLPPPTATLQPTLLPGETPTTTPTPIPLPNEIIAVMDQIESQVEGVRGLQGPAEIERQILVNSVLRQQMATILVTEETTAMVEDQKIVLEALGFINADYNLIDSFLSSHADAVGGYYLPTEDKLYVIGNYADGFGALEQYVYAQEYAHAIQDANYDLTSLGIFPLCEGPIQSCQAVRSLIKGEAALVSQTWLDQFPPSGGLQSVLNYDPQPVLFQSSPPPYFEMESVFADTYGLAFVQYLFDNGGWNSVNRAFSVLPTTTEQIMHPEKYQQRETAWAINAPDYSALLPQEWELVADDSLGEWNSYLLLAHNDYTNAKQPEDDAAIAAEGWAADKYQVYYNPEERQVFLSAYWVWDTPEDSSQFYNLLNLSLNSRFGNAKVESGGGSTCWLYQGQKSCIQQDANKLYWLLSEDGDLLDTVRERFRLFP